MLESKYRYYYGLSPPQSPGSSWVAKVAVGQQLGSRGSVWAAVGSSRSSVWAVVGNSWAAV